MFTFDFIEDAKKDERERILNAFKSLAAQMDEKADADDTDAGLVWTAAASSVRRVCDEV